MIYVDPWLALITAGFAIYGIEQLVVNLVRWYDRRDKKPKGPTGFVPPKT